MHLLDLTLGMPAQDLALDEALWEGCEAGGPEALRFWESPVPFVVLGYANRIASEVSLETCRQRNIPVLRRITGGGAVLQGPGCLNYTLVLRVAASGPTANVSATNLHIMNRHAATLTRVLGRPVRRRGDTDLAIGDRKFSGNAQRRGRHALLFHGTILCDCDLELMDAVLPPPSRQPDYRAGRGHAAFLKALDVPADRVKVALRQAWEDGAVHQPGPPNSTVVGRDCGRAGSFPPAGGLGGSLAPPTTPGATEAARRQQPPDIAAPAHPDWQRIVARARELARTKYDTHEWTFRF